MTFFAPARKLPNGTKQQRKNSKDNRAKPDVTDGQLRVHYPIAAVEFPGSVFRLTRAPGAFNLGRLRFSGVSLVTFFAPAKKVTRWREATAEALALTKTDLQEQSEDQNGFPLSRE